MLSPVGAVSSTGISVTPEFSARLGLFRRTAGQRTTLTTATCDCDSTQRPCTSLVLGNSTPLQVPSSVCSFLGCAVHLEWLGAYDLTSSTRWFESRCVQKFNKRTKTPQSLRLRADSTVGYTFANTECDMGSGGQGDSSGGQGDRKDIQCDVWE